MRIVTRVAVSGSGYARASLTIVLGLLLAVLACGSRPPGLPDSTRRDPPITPIMGASTLTQAGLVAWFGHRTPQPEGRYALELPVVELARLFLAEGTAEGVRGDIAFMQAILETGWFRFRGQVDAASFNFAGIGASDGRAHARFPDARTGVRAQIQHLRAYADPAAATCTVPPLRNPCVDPRFHLVLPKGRARAWNDLGSGNWAGASGYGTTILRLYEEAAAFESRTVAR